MPEQDGSKPNKPDFELLEKCMEAAGWKLHKITLLHEETGMIAEFGPDILCDPPALEGALTVFLPQRMKDCRASVNRRNN
jgi:hypothetical protein